MNLFQTISLAIIEGVTEFLPISSTGHLIIGEKLLSIPSTEFVKSFNIFIQLGAILAVVWIYLPTIISERHLYKNIFISFLPTATVGLIFYKFVKTYLLGNLFITIMSLLIGGIVLLFVDRWFNKPTKKPKFTNYLSVGLFQSLSIIPGVSRSAASIIGGLANGLSREDAVKFSFLLAIPTMVAATGLDLIKTSHSFTGPEITQLGIGFVVAFITAFAAVKSFTQYVSKNSFAIFGVYRILLAIVLLILLKP